MGALIGMWQPSIAPMTHGIPFLFLNPNSTALKSSSVLGHLIIHLDVQYELLNTIEQKWNELSSG